MELDEKVIFISYTNADQERVGEVADQLVARSFELWMDHRKLKPGQNWDFEIRKALDRAAIIVIFISNRSIKKNGYVQREIRLALEKAEEKVVEDIYLIPVLLDDDVTLPRQLKDLQYIRASDDDFIEKLSGTIGHQLEQIGIESKEAQDDAELNWTSYRISERRDGAPGYEADFRLFRFNSDIFPAVAQIGDHIKGKLLENLFEIRSELLDTDSNFNYGQSRFYRTHTLDVSSPAPVVQGRILSLVFASHSYYAGAAHPNMHFTSFAYFIDPLFAISNVAEIFEDKDAAFAVVQAEVRRQLLQVRLGDDEEMALDSEWVERGTVDWSDLDVFAFTKDGIEFPFSPYKVAPYAAGPQFAEVKYEVVKDLLKPAFKSALDIGW